MPIDIQTLLSNPDFHSLPLGEKNKALMETPEFSSLPPKERAKALDEIHYGAPEKTPDESPTGFLSAVTGSVPPEEQRGFGAGAGRLVRMPWDLAKTAVKAASPSLTDQYEVGQSVIRPQLDLLAQGAKGLMRKPDPDAIGAQTRMNAGTPSPRDLEDLKAAGEVAAGALPGAGPWAASLGERVGRGDLSGAATELGGGLALGEATGRVAGAVPKGPKPFTSAEALDHLQKALPPSKSAPWEPTDFDAARPHLEGSGVKIKNVETLRDAADAAIKKIEDKVQKEYVGSKSLQTIQTNPVDVVRQKLSGNPRGDFAERGVNSLKKLDLGLDRGFPKVDPQTGLPSNEPLGQKMTWPEADAARRQLNQENNAVLAKNNYDRAVARSTDPGFAAREAASEHLRNEIYDGLEASGIKGVRELRQAEGSLLRLRDAAQNQLYGGEKVVPGTGVTTPLRQVGKNLTKMAATGAGALIGGAPGAMAGGVAGESLGKLFTPDALTRDALIERSFSKNVTNGPKFPEKPKPIIPQNTPSANIITGSGARGDVYKPHQPTLVKTLLSDTLFPQLGQEVDPKSINAGGPQDVFANRSEESVGNPGVPPQFVQGQPLAEPQVDTGFLTPQNQGLPVDLTGKVPPESIPSAFPENWRPSPYAPSDPTMLGSLLTEELPRRPLPMPASSLPQSLMLRSLLEDAARKYLQGAPQ